MVDENKWGIIVQARTGSKRLPQKMLLPFGQEKKLLNVILDNLKQFFPSAKIVVATTTNTKDDVIEKITKDDGVNVFRGSEEDVLDRFIQAAEQQQWTHVVRVCADNPFLYGGNIMALAEKAKLSNADYVSWFFKDGLPAIRSHSGFFPEWIMRKALEKIALNTSESLYREHVTNYIYDNADSFTIEKIPIEDEDFFRAIRLTIDTEDDYFVLRKMFDDLKNENNDITPGRIKKHIDERPELKSQMKINISKNEK